MKIKVKYIKNIMRKSWPRYREAYRLWKYLESCKRVNYHLSTLMDHPLPEKKRRNIEIRLGEETRKQYNASRMFETLFKELSTEETEKFKELIDEKA